MARYVQRGQSRGKGHGRYDQLRSSSSGGLMAATMILGACLVISIILTVAERISHNNTRMDYNVLQAKFDLVKEGKVHTKRADDQEIRVQVDTTAGCPNPVCRKIKATLDGTKHELRLAHKKMSQKQIDELQFNYDVVSQNVSLDYVIDPVNPDLQLLQISFKVRNKSSEPRGNILGLFKLYKGKDMAWQKKFEIATLAPGATTSMRFMAPGHVKWNEWGCQLHPSMQSLGDGSPKR